MQQYRIEFFKNHYAAEPENRRLIYVHHDFMSDVDIDDDYLAIQTTVVDISPTTKVEIGQIVRILRENQDYFLGVVTDVSNGENETRVYFKPFISIFDEEVLFNVLDQHYMVEGVGITLEASLKKYIEQYYVNNTDAIQDYPLDITIPDTIYQTKPWSMGITGSSEDSLLVAVGLYSKLIVLALKAFGVAVTFRPNFSTGRIAVTIGKPRSDLHIDADLDNVTVKTFKVNDRASSLNKLTIYDTNTLQITHYYVHPDMTWGNREPDDRVQNRITPVNREIRSVTTSGSYSDDPATDFLYEAEAVAYEELSGLEWNNLIELECMPDDTLVNPSSIRIGQKIVIHYNKVAYSSILTGRSVSYDNVTLMFGSERIAFSKKKNSK